LVVTHDTIHEVCVERFVRALFDMNPAIMLIVFGDKLAMIPASFFVFCISVALDKHRL
jgi:hypothetical protein